MLCEEQKYKEEWDPVEVQERAQDAPLPVLDAALLAL